jgi:biotin-[acetyl-CoA-carboxylase] ligase BirA-like protein
LLILSENIELAKCYIGDSIPLNRISLLSLPNIEQKLWKELSNEKSLYSANIENKSIWECIFILGHARRSQYDTLIKFIDEQKQCTNNILCLADSGDSFHGQRNRHWESLSGNLHLSVLLSPNKSIQNFSVGFLVLSAVSVLETIDSIKGLENKAKIKWVNDILIDYSKICGVIAQTHVQGDLVKNAVLGIGLNVKSSPVVEPNAFIPKTACLADFQPDKELCNQRIVFNELLNNLSLNYITILEGNIQKLIQKYKLRSLAIGRQVNIWSDTPEGHSEIIHSGVVTDIGKNLELYLEGKTTPVLNGRMQLLK